MAISLASRTCDVGILWQPVLDWDSACNVVSSLVSIEFERQPQAFRAFLHLKFWGFCCGGRVVRAGTVSS